MSCEPGSSVTKPATTAAYSHHAGGVAARDEQERKNNVRNGRAGKGKARMIRIQAIFMRLSIQQSGTIRMIRDGMEWRNAPGRPTSGRDVKVITSPLMTEKRLTPCAPVFQRGTTASMRPPMSGRSKPLLCTPFCPADRLFHSITECPGTPFDAIQQFSRPQRQITQCP